MKRCPPWILLLVLFLLIAGSAFAQYQTGNIYGKVVAKDGAVLPGVTVVLFGIGAPQTAISGPNGDFHFVNLSPGGFSGTIAHRQTGFDNWRCSTPSLRRGANSLCAIRFARPSAKSLSTPLRSQPCFPPRQRIRMGRTSHVRNAMSPPLFSGQQLAIAQNRTMRRWPSCSRRIWSGAAIIFPAHGSGWRLKPSSIRSKAATSNALPRTWILWLKQSTIACASCHGVLARQVE